MFTVPVHREPSDDPGQWRPEEVQAQIAHPAYKKEDILRYNKANPKDQFIVGVTRGKPPGFNNWYPIRGGQKKRVPDEIVWELSGPYQTPAVLDESNPYLPGFNLPIVVSKWNSLYESDKNTRNQYGVARIYIHISELTESEKQRRLAQSLCVESTNSSSSKSVVKTKKSKSKAKDPEPEYESPDEDAGQSSASNTLSRHGNALFSTSQYQQQQQSQPKFGLSDFRPLHIYGPVPSAIYPYGPFMPIDRGVFQPPQAEVQQQAELVKRTVVEKEVTVTRKVEKEKKKKVSKESERVEEEGSSEEEVVVKKKKDKGKGKAKEGKEGKSKKKA